MPLHRYNVRARRIKLFTRTKQSPSLNTFINNNTNNSIKSDLSSSIVKSDNMLHSKSTYFYHGGISSKFNYLIPSVCGLAFLVGLGMTISPATNVANQASATDNDGIMTTAAGDPNISLTVNGNTEMKKNVTTPGEVSYVDNTFSVSVSNSWYAVMVRAANGYTSDLINQQNTNAKVTGVGYNVPEANFKENTWGYALTTTTNTANNALTYNTVPESNDFTPAYSATATGTQNQNFKIAFAAKFGNDAPNGNYQTKVYLSAVSDPMQVTAFGGITTMQELTKTECAKAGENTTKQLRDERDNKYYWITKLRDGNCWMTQNLDLDITSDTELTPNDSDVTSNWKPGDSVKFVDTDGVLSASTWGNNHNDINIYNPGYWAYSNDDDPSSTNSCSNSSTNTSFSACSAKGWVDVTAMTPYSHSPLASDEQIVDNTSKQYDAHYLIGNYYSWEAATAGSGNKTSNNARAEQSICPKGWTLPLSYSDNDTKSGSFYYTLNLYNLTGPNTSKNMSKNPLYFLYGGYIWPSSSTYVNGAGLYGCYWSSVPKSGSDVYTLFFNAYDVTPSRSDYYHYYGRSIRCLLKAN